MKKYLKYTLQTIYIKKTMQIFSKIHTKISLKLKLPNLLHTIYTPFT